MAEFCLKCWNNINQRNDTERSLILSEELDLCEECGEWTHVVVRVRGNLLQEAALRLYILIRYGWERE